MGSLKDLMEKIPGISGMIPPGTNVDDKELVRIEAMIQSMTRHERADPYALVREPTRVTRIARGSGQPEQGVSELVQKFLFMKQMMSGMGQNMGLLGNIPGMKNLNMARQMRRAMKSGKLQDMMNNMGGIPGAPGMGGGMPGMGMPGMGMPGMGMPGMGMPGMPGFGMPGMGGTPGDGTPRMKALSKSERNARKADRKRERAARKKGKKR
jgi:signal recognition particle subunit SRP54